MKTILYNPIFINPQAYYVFPRLTRYLQPDNESTVEPANYIGTIEVKVIAYGDTTLKRTYTNTDSIDLSEFKNTWIRISLFTKVGSCVLGEWKIGNMESDLPYIDPEVLASLKAVVIVGNKTNNDSDRAIVKNLVDASNPFILSNFAYEGMSGYNGYPIILRGTNRTYQDKASYVNVVGDDKNVINLTRISFNTAAIFSYVKQNGALTSYNKDIESFKIKVTGIDYSRFVIKYSYISEANATAKTTMTIASDSIYELPKSFTSDGSLTSNDVWIGFSFTKQSGDIPDVIEDVNVTIEVISEYTGALVTDGVDDMITSTKTVKEMLVGSNECTVVSMMANLDSMQIMCNSNFSNTNGYNVRNTLEPNGVISILGYTDKNGTTNNLNLIMGDKNSIKLVDKVNFNSDYVFHPSSYNVYSFKTAWYWTIIANKVLTTDQINQVIAYFNLDRTLKPDILCDVKKQGITNDNHAEFGDRLIDFSGNGRDIQLNNIAWKGNSGIGNYPVDFTSLTKTGRVDTITHNSISYSTGDRSYYIVYKGLSDKIDTPAFKIKIKGISLNVVYFYINSKGIRTSVVFNKDGVYELPTSYNSLYTGTEIYVSGLASDGGSGVITIIPSNAGALCLDGVNDFGKVTGMPIYKDYTFIIDRKFLNETFANQVCLASKSKVAVEGENGGAFIIDNISINAIINPYSFYKTTSLPNLNTFDKQIVFQTKYKYLGKDIAAGTATDSDTLWLGTFRDNDNRFANVAIYSLMSFPYSMSEFLIERQLKKHKLGTLYPDMVEFRPIIKANDNYKIFYTAMLPLTGNIWERINIGDYVPVGRRVAIQLSFDNAASELVSAISSQLGNISITKNSNNKGYTIFGDILKNKSPQKINITIDEYIRYEDIVQPYPVLLRFKDESGKEVSWGGKFRVGSTITRIGSAADSNLLPNIYNIFGLLLNDNQVTSSKVIVEKTMVFKAKSAYIFDNNEPKCILSPRLLRIPNSSYKILGYIPDISGHGNHGKINNSAYAEGSGANEDGSWQFDGVDDFITIPTLGHGGKQVLMKVNWQNRTGILYDQRMDGSSIDTFAILNVNSNNSIAYNSRNTDGETYIDGILNRNIVCPQLYKITHNITIINQLANKEETMSPTIGSNTTHSTYFSQMALYDFMLFDNISTDDKIKELNEYVGIEGNTE